MYFKDEGKRREFEMVVDLSNPETVEISEINTVFNDDTSLHTRVRLLPCMHHRRNNMQHKVEGWCSLTRFCSICQSAPFVSQSSS